MDQRNLLDKLVAPDREEQRKKRIAVRQTMYYILIIVVSIIAMLVVPFFAGGVQGDFQLYFPKSTIGWIVYWIIRGGMAILNISIFALFKLQAKVNVKGEPNYIQAKELLHKVSGKMERKPRSPAQMEAKEWSTKGITIFFTSIVMGATLSALVLSFDLVTFLSCIITVIMGIIFGYCTMRQNEIYWTEEYLEYAQMKALELAEQEEENENA